MKDKISIILPIFNVGDHLRGGIDSLVNQTIGNENLEIIMVNDCSTDGSDKIIDEYDEKYECCKAIHHEKNSGAAYTPRNLDAVETLYNTVKANDAQMAFGRFRRIFEYGGKVQKSYSPYKDDIEKEYPGETFETENFIKVPDFLWDNVVERLLYGKTLEVTYPRDKPLDTIKVDNIEEEPDLLKMHPSIWSKIYRRDLIMDNDIRFQPFISGDDLAFYIEALIHSKGIVFLNNFMCYDYYIRDLPDDKSITNNVNVRLLDELMESYIYSRQCTEGFSKEVQNATVNPHLLHWTYTWKNSQFTVEENKLLLSKVNRLKEIHRTDLKTKWLLSSMTTAIETKIKTSRK